MVQITRVLCPVDFSDFSRRALDYAVALARWYDAPLTVLYVYYVVLPSAALFASIPTGPLEAFALSPADREQLRSQMQSLLPQSAAGLRVEYTVAEGDVATEILAEAEKADILVIGTHGRSGFEHLVLGSVTEKVLRKASCPVLTIPRVSPDATTTVPALFHHVLVAVDFFEPSLDALVHALSLAEEADAHLTVMHVTDIPRELTRWAGEAAEGRKYVEQWKAQALAQVKAIVPPDACTYCHVDERVEAGVPYREILRVAREQHSDLIVMGTRGAGPVERRFVGSTAQHVVRESVCPVLTVRKR